MATAVTVPPADTRACDAGDDATRDPVAHHFHRADLCVGIVEDPILDPAENLCVFDAPADGQTLDRHARQARRGRISHRLDRHSRRVGADHVVHDRDRAGAASDHDPAAVGGPGEERAADEDLADVALNIHLA